MQTTVLVFSELAIVTSFIGFVVGLENFLSDALEQPPWLPSPSPEEPLIDVDSTKHISLATNNSVCLVSRVNEKSVYALVLLPSLFVALIKPNIFFGALDTAGALGISVRTFPLLVMPIDVCNCQEVHLPFLLKQGAI